MRIKQHSNSKWFQKKQSRNNNLKSPKSLPENPEPSSQKSVFGLAPKMPSIWRWSDQRFSLDLDICCGIIMIPSGKHTKNYGKSPCSMVISTISMAILNSYVKYPEGRYLLWDTMAHEATAIYPLCRIRVCPLLLAGSWHMDFTYVIYLCKQI